MTKKELRAEDRRHEEAILKLWEAYALITEERCDIQAFVRSAIVGLAEKVPISSGASEGTPPL